MSVLRFSAMLMVITMLSGCKIEFITPEKEMRAVIDGQIEALNVEDIEKTMSFSHDDAPMYDQQIAMLQKIKETFDLKTSLISFEYVGMSNDGEYAFAIIKQKTEKIQGPGFRDNLVTSGATYKREKGVWKLWQSVTFDVKFLDEK